MFDLKGKVALVTGARRGMGESHALVLAKQGASVAVTDIDLKECEKVVAAIKKAGGKAKAWKLDVTNPTEISNVFAAVVKSFGRLDILVNNAGVYLPKAALEMTEADWDKTLDINLKGEFFCAQAAAKQMAQQKSGKIINIASVASGGVGVGLSGGVHYTASKGGIVAMTESLADEWAPYGIQVNCIGPGGIHTPMADVTKMPKEILDAFLAKIPMQRFGQPEEVSAAVVFLASNEASYVTGATLYVDGGWLAA